MLSSLVAAVGLFASYSAQDSLRPYPIADTTTNSFLNHSSYIEGFADQQWYLDNIPFIDVPDKTIQDVYYYRTSVVKRHLKYFHQGVILKTTDRVRSVC